MENNARKQPPNDDVKPRKTRSTRKNAIGAFVYFVCFVVSLHASSALAAPRLAIPSEGVAFGEIAAGEGASKSIEIRNVSAYPVAVAQVKGCCVADASLSAMRIAPSESATLTVSLHPMLPGEFSKDIRILCDDPDRPMLTIPATGVATEGTSAVAASRFTLPAILLAGIADGFNPCAFSIVIALAGIPSPSPHQSATMPGE